MTLRTFRCFDYVNRPFAIVVEALSEDAIGVLAQATAPDQGSEASLRVAVGPLTIGADIVLELESVESALAPDPRTTFGITWRASRGASLFPAMRADLIVYPLSATETQLELLCQYEPPLGFVGGALDRVALHRVAEASLESFLQQVARHLRIHLPEARSAAVGA